MKVSTRLLFLIGAAVLGLAILGGLSLNNLHRTLLSEREAEITNMLRMAEHLVKFYHDEQVRGHMTQDQAQAAAKLALTQMNNDNKSYFWVRLPNGLNLVHPRKEVVGTVFQGKAMDGRVDADAYVEAMAKTGVGVVRMVTKNPATGNMGVKLNGVVAFEPWNWWIGTGFFDDDIKAEFYQAALRFGLFFTLTLAVIATLGWRLARSINRTLGADPRFAADVTQRIAAKDFSQAIPLAGAHDGSLLHAIARMQDELAGTVHGIRDHSATIAATSAQIAAHNGDLAARTEEQARGLEETAAAMEQLTSTVQQNAEHTRRADALARRASDAVQQGGAVMADVVRTMQAIEASSKRIGDITGVIDGIAFQTNILALNAAVEAARAGEQGRGFAVVAGEVRNLAQRAAAAASEIKGLIEASVSEVGNGSRLVAQAGTTMDGIVGEIRQVGTIIGEIASASTEQAQGLEQINRTIVDMDGATQQNAALVEQAAGSAQALRELAGELDRMMAAFRLDAAGQPPAAVRGDARQRLAA